MFVVFLSKLALEDLTKSVLDMQSQLSRVLQPAPLALESGSSAAAAGELAAGAAGADDPDMPVFRVGGAPRSGSRAAVS